MGKTWKNHGTTWKNMHKHWSCCFRNLQTNSKNCVFFHLNRGGWTSVKTSPTIAVKTRILSQILCAMIKDVVVPLHCGTLGFSLGWNTLWQSNMIFWTMSHLLVFPVKIRRSTGRSLANHWPIFEFLGVLHPTILGHLQSLVVYSLSSHMAVCQNQ